MWFWRRFFSFSVLTVSFGLGLGLEPLWTWTWLGLEPLWTWTWLGLEPLWTWTWLGLEPLWTWTWLGLEPLWTWTCLGLDKGGLDYSPRTVCCLKMCVFEPSEISISELLLFCSMYGPFINHIVNIQSINSPVLPGKGRFCNIDFTARDGPQRSHNSVILSKDIVCVSGLEINFFTW